MELIGIDPMSAHCELPQTSKTDHLPLRSVGLLYLVSYSS